MHVHVTMPRLSAPSPATKGEALAIITGQREDERNRRAKLPEWRRYFEDLMLFVPEADRREAALTIVPLMNAMGRAAILDARKFSSECFSVMDAESSIANQSNPA